MQNRYWDLRNLYSLQYCRSSLRTCRLYTRRRLYPHCFNLLQPFILSPHPISFLNQFPCFLSHPFPSISVSVFPLPPLEGTIFGIQSFVHFIKLTYPSQFAFDSHTPRCTPCFPRSHCSTFLGPSSSNCLFLRNCISFLAHLRYLNAAVT